eukprot:29053-Rhodomonas_salina.1
MQETAFGLWKQECLRYCETVCCYAVHCTARGMHYEGKTAGTATQGLAVLRSRTAIPYDATADHGTDPGCGSRDGIRWNT